MSTGRPRCLSMRRGATLTQGRRGGKGGAGMVSTGGRIGARAKVAPDERQLRTLCAMASDDGRDGRGLSSGARLGLVVGGIAVLVVAFLIARGGGNDDSSTTSSTQATTQSRTNADSQTTPDHSGR